MHAAIYVTTKKGGDGLQKVPNCMVLDLIYLCVQFWTTVHSLGFTLCIFISSKMPHLYFYISLLLIKFRCFCHIMVDQSREKKIYICKDVKHYSKFLLDIKTLSCLSVSHFWYHCTTTYTLAVSTKGEKASYSITYNTVASWGVHVFLFFKVNRPWEFKEKKIETYKT